MIRAALKLTTYGKQVKLFSRRYKVGRQSRLLAHFVRVIITNERRLSHHK